MNIYISSTYHFPVAGDTTENKHPGRALWSELGDDVWWGERALLALLPWGCGGSCQWRIIPTKLLPMGRACTCRGDTGTADKHCRNGRKKGRRAEEEGEREFPVAADALWKMKCGWEYQRQGRMPVSILICGRSASRLGRMGTQRRPPWGEVTWSEIGMMRYSHYAKICGRTVPAEGTNFSRNLEWDPSHMLCLWWFLWDTNESLRFGWYLLDLKAWLNGRCSREKWGTQGKLWSKCQLQMGLFIYLY